MNPIKKINFPVSADAVSRLACGDILHLSGTIFTGRDAFHKYLFDGGKIDFSLAGQGIYHCGPVMKKVDEHWEVIAAGPTTSIREEPYMAQLIKDYSIRAVIGKGGMGDKTAEACKKYKCLYLAAPGGCAQILANSIKCVESVSFLEEFGSPEAVWELKIKDFPVIVAIDTTGRNLFKEIETESRNHFLSACH
ncbi:MAG: FumA C-terminus/TtdB family hydratase beta subunit [Verrucomicrobiota bacterium]|nr:FumA C-terminus/TtdB family hydratase beta subunit [Verrucomicrobiota bacterium]